MQFIASGANAKSFPNDEELAVGGEEHQRFRVFNTVMCGTCTTTFKSIVKGIGEHATKVRFQNEAGIHLLHNRIHFLAKFYSQYFLHENILVGYFI